MDDLELELRAAWFDAGAIDTQRTWEHMAQRAHALLAKPVATREAPTYAEVERYVGTNVRPFGDLDINSTAAVLLLWRALSHFAPPARPRMMIEGMSVDDLEALFRREWEGQEWAVMCAHIAHRLATTPAPEVDPDEGAKRLAWEFHKAALIQLDIDNAEDLWVSFKDHQRVGWRAVAAKKEAGGE